jgi:NitT/TauT family transport system substrate-binding protein
MTTTRRGIVTGMGLLAAAAAIDAVVRRRASRPASPGTTANRAELKVGFLPVTCHLTCPVTDFATATSKTGTHFISQRFTDFPTLVETVKSGALDAAFLTVPLSMKLFSQGVPIRLAYLGHRDGSTLIVHKDVSARSIHDLRNMRVAIPNRASNQYLVLRHLMEKEGMAAEDLHFIELAPPDMPSALAVRSIDAYFVGEPFAAKAELAGTGRVLYLAKDMWPGFISCGLVVTDRVIASDPKVVRDLVRGIAESGEWAEDHRAEAAKIVSPYFRQDENLIRFVLTQPPDRVSYRHLTPSKEELQAILDMAVREGVVPKQIDLDAFVATAFLPDDVHPAEIDIARLREVHSG